jgi:hypothetical protein
MEINVRFGWYLMTALSIDNDVLLVLYMYMYDIQAS